MMTTTPRVNLDSLAVRAVRAFARDQRWLAYTVVDSAEAPVAFAALCQVPTPPHLERRAFVIVVRGDGEQASAWFGPGFLEDAIMVTSVWWHRTGHVGEVLECVRAEVETVRLKGPLSGPMRGLPAYAQVRELREHTWHLQLTRP